MTQQVLVGIRCCTGVGAHLRGELALLLVHRSQPIVTGKQQHSLVHFTLTEDTDGAGLHYADHLVNGLLEVWNVDQQPRRLDRVEFCISVGQSQHVSLGELRVWQVLPCLHKLGLQQVNAEKLCGLAAQGFFQVSEITAHGASHIDTFGVLYILHTLCNACSDPFSQRDCRIVVRHGVVDLDPRLAVRDDCRTRGSSIAVGSGVASL
mmetsp:Transcript_21933/g.42068  ORF Transcript_21933/g.42068 Transcript_21933/m.42068 type:complete len:207 (+) Transcript_21933:333-953(+)